MPAKFHRVKCGEWRLKNKGLDLKKLQKNMLQETLKKVKNGDIIYLEYIDMEIPNIWNGFRLYFNSNLYSIGGNPNLDEIDYTVYPEEDWVNSEIIEIPESDITKILKKEKLNKNEKGILQCIKDNTYTNIFKYELSRYKKEYNTQLKEGVDIWDTYSSLSPSRDELVMVREQIKKIKKI
tara:strand:+ start:237 stop:776 length:540 start_codon:yes stop_codon:yes gene_type:complete